jgi:hypothetical protein
MKKQINLRKVSYVVEADIKSFFDTVDHDWLIKFLEHDIEDKKMIRLITKFLKAGAREVSGERRGDPAGKWDVARTCKYLFALCAGYLVRKGSEGSVQRRSWDDTLC